MTDDSHSSIRLVLSDMDGTILSAERTLSLQTKIAVQNLRQAGVAVALVSARPPQGMLPYVQQLGLQGPCAAFNGGLIFSADGTVCAESIFPASLVRELLAQLTPHGGEIWLQNKEHWFVQDTRHPLVRHESSIIGVEPYEVQSFSDAAEHVNRIIAIGYEPEHAASLERQLGEFFVGQASVLRSTPTKINITPAAATKGHALKILASLHRVSPAQVACLGDANNDLPMFCEAGISIAMGQASDAVKHKATHVARSNAEDGWADAVERFIMPRVLHS